MCGCWAWVVCLDGRAWCAFVLVSAGLCGVLAVCVVPACASVLRVEELRYVPRAYAFAVRCFVRDVGVCRGGRWRRGRARAVLQWLALGAAFGGGRLSVPIMVVCAQRVFSSADLKKCPPPVEGAEERKSGRADAL